MDEAIRIRSNWTKGLEFALEQELDKAGNPSTVGGDIDIAYGHGRFRMLGPVAPQCRDLEQFGVGDEEKRACGLTRMLGSNCMIVSLGSKNQWSFEEAIHEKLPNCMIHTFDCTVDDSAKPPDAISKQTVLHRICIGAKDEIKSNKKEFMSWGSVMRLIGATEPPLYLKMDIEGHEFQVLSNGIPFFTYAECVKGRI